MQFSAFLKTLSPARFKSRLIGVGRVFSLLLFVFSISLIWLGLTSVANELAHTMFITGAVLLGGAIGLSILISGGFDNASELKELRPLLYYSVAAGLAVFIVFFICRCGMHQIGGYDHSIMVDQGWRLYIGQTPYVDYPCTVPVAFPLGVKFAFRWFGVYWRSIIYFTALFTLLAFFWELFLLTKLFGRRWHTLLWAMAVPVFSPMLVSYWWYSPISAVSGVILILSAVVWRRQPDSIAAMVSYGAGLLLMATMKANIAGVLIVGFSIIFFLSRPHRWKMVVISATSFLGFCILMAANHFSVLGMIQAYIDIAPRGASTVPFLIDLSNTEKRTALLAVISLLLPAVVVLTWKNQTLPLLLRLSPIILLVFGLTLFLFKTDIKLLGLNTLLSPLLLAVLIAGRPVLKLRFWVPIVALLGGIYGFMTNSEQKLVDLPPIFIAALLLVAETSPRILAKAASLMQLRSGWSRYFGLVCAVLGMTALAQGVARDRVKSIGYYFFFEYQGSAYTVEEGFFKGVRCGRLFHEMLQALNDVMQENIESPVWFGPRMQWAYAAYHRPSPLNEPVVWDPLTMFKTKNEDLYFNQFLEHRHPILILRKDDLANYSLKEYQEIRQHYLLDDSSHYLTIMHLGITQPTPPRRNTPEK